VPGEKLECGLRFDIPIKNQTLADTIECGTAVRLTEERGDTSLRVQADCRRGFAPKRRVFRGFGDARSLNTARLTELANGGEAGFMQDKGFRLKKSRSLPLPEILGSTGAASAKASTSRVSSRRGSAGRCRYHEPPRNRCHCPLDKASPALYEGVRKTDYPP
jgi:hypothetical protein